MRRQFIATARGVVKKINVLSRALGQPEYELRQVRRPGCPSLSPAEGVDAGNKEA